MVLQCAVQGNQEIEVQWFKEGQAIDIKQESKFSVQKKKSEVREGETIVQLEIKVGTEGNHCSARDKGRDRRKPLFS